MSPKYHHPRGDLDTIQASWYWECTHVELEAEDASFGVGSNSRSSQGEKFLHRCSGERVADQVCKGRTGEPQGGLKTFEQEASAWVEAAR